MTTISKPYTFSAGAVITASEHNSNFDTIYDDHNGEITNANIKSTAAIVDTKLAQITTASKVAWSAIPTVHGVINFVIDGGGSAITTGVKGDLYIPFGCTLTAYTILPDQSGSIVIDVWKDTYANFPPTDADSMCSGKEPTLSSNTKAQDTDISDWTTVAVAAGNTLRFNVDSAATVTRVTLALNYTRT